MKTCRFTRRIDLIRAAVVCGLVLGFSTASFGAGISVDAGLTPAEDRWIVRSQVRYLERDDDPSPLDREMEAFAFPVVVAYGLRHDLTLLARQAVVHRKRSMMGSSDTDTGAGDFFLLTKYQAYRVDTPSYSFGIAPTLGLEFPSGSDEFSSETWDLHTGLYLSGRSGPWAADFNAVYLWNGFADNGRFGINPGDEAILTVAGARQFPVGSAGAAALAPVLELTYRNFQPDRLDGADVADTGGDVFYVSPGMKYSTESIVLEALLQIPVWQDHEGSQPDWQVGGIVGVRFLF